MKFTPITPSDYPSLKPFFDQQGYRLCSYSLSSIIVWNNDVYHPCGAVDNGSLIICADFPTHAEKTHLLLPIAPGREYAPEELAGLSSRTGCKRYWFVPGDYIERHRENRLEELFTVERQEEYDDYVYRTEDLAMLEGRKYAKKRNLIRQFEREYVEESGNVVMKHISPDDVPGCLAFLDRWCEERGGDVDRDEDLACEWHAARNALKNLDVLEFRSLMLSINGEIEAFGIASRLTETMSALHFQKASIQIKGLYQFFDRECARRLFPELEYINKESDMGIPGLAHVKKSYYPAMMIPSYKLILREK
jgi:hypothetical protein